MNTVAKNVPTLYKAPHVHANVTGVRVVDLRFAGQFFGTPAEIVTYEGTQDALQQACLVPSAMFAAVPKSGKKSARFLHTDGREEHVRLSRRAGGLWRVIRRHFMENSYEN